VRVSDTTPRRIDAACTARADRDDAGSHDGQATADEQENGMAGEVNRRRS
jgi:hypothetical protein